VVRLKPESEACRHDSNGGRSLPATRTRQSRNPPRQAPTELFILTIEAGAQGALFVKHHERVEAPEEKYSILCYAPILVKQRLSEHHRQHRGVHGLAIDAIQTVHNRSVRGKDRRRRSLRAQEKRRTPEIANRSQKKTYCPRCANSSSRDECAQHPLRKPYGNDQRHKQRENACFYRVGSRAHRRHHRTPARD
jgi:hypothetical protein